MDIEKKLNPPKPQTPSQGKRKKSNLKTLKGHSPAYFRQLYHQKNDNAAAAATTAKSPSEL